MQAYRAMRAASARLSRWPALELCSGATAHVNQLTKGKQHAGGQTQASKATSTALCFRLCTTVPNRTAPPKKPHRVG